MTDKIGDKRRRITTTIADADDVINNAYSPITAQYLPNIYLQFYQWT